MNEDGEQTGYLTNEEMERRQPFWRRFLKGAGRRSIGLFVFLFAVISLPRWSVI